MGASVIDTDAFPPVASSLVTSGNATRRRSTVDASPELETASTAPEEAVRADAPGVLARSPLDADPPVPTDGVNDAPLATGNDAPAADPATTPPNPALGDADGKDPRRRRRARAAEEDGEEGDAAAGLGPMVRHLATLTKELSEAQRMVGRLSAERDHLRRQLGESQPDVLALADGPDETIRPSKGARLEAKAAKLAERTVGPEPVPTPEELQSRAQEVGRRRRFIALGMLALIGVMVGLWQVMEWPSPIDSATKQGLTGIAYIGPFMNVLLGGFLIYRLVRVGGKAGSWLFPSPEEPRKRRRSSAP